MAEPRRRPSSRTPAHQAEEKQPDATPEQPAKAKGRYKVMRNLIRDGEELHVGDAVSFREGEEEHVAELLRIGAIERT